MQWQQVRQERAVFLMIRQQRRSLGFFTNNTGWVHEAVTRWWLRWSGNGFENATLFVHETGLRNPPSRNIEGHHTPCE